MSAKTKRIISWALATLQLSPNEENGEVSDALTATVARDSSYLGLTASERSDVRSELSACKDENSENKIPTFSRREVADHCCSQSCWMVIDNKVYDVTRFLRSHPGGEDIMLEHGGHDATSAFFDKGHSRDAFNMLAEYCIGEVTKADWIVEKNCT
ncbi:cytochrome b5 [Biomphalaria pfeifferi]|uniref:Cytochrome b5 n=1 Tax=Biomphalaria pfeifferi TaxID=112525 RepID=A0AAD8AZA3_BIOPF|nr:cytochrome b5 [Biomphalaria pfeifferi]